MVHWNDTGNEYVRQSRASEYSASQYYGQQKERQSNIRVFLLTTSILAAVSAAYYTGYQLSQKQQKPTRQKIAEIKAFTFSNYDIGSEEYLSFLKKISPSPIAKKHHIIDTPKSLIPPEIEASTLRRGNHMLNNGDIVGARLIFQYLAERGSKNAAFATALTYDKFFLSKISVMGLQPDDQMAVKWYLKAKHLGHHNATQMLQKFGY